MEKIKIYILTYKNPEALDNNLESLFNSDADLHNTEIHIINNHSEVFSLAQKFSSKVIVHHQNLRANWGCGNPSRDWNQAIVQAFRDLDNPDCDQLILCQDDCIWDKDWQQRLIKIHKQYTLYQCSWGDCFISLLPDAIRKIGLFDERMCTLGYYEGDFLLRAWLYNKEKSSINDFHHKRVWNETETIVNRSDDERRVPPYMQVSQNVFEQKWPRINPQRWEKSLFNYPPACSSITNFMFYPYFEHKIENLFGKNYLVNNTPEESTKNLTFNKIISHRGNLTGPDPALENNPAYITKAIEQGYDCEIDVWFVDNCWYLGHDNPEHLVDIQFLKQPALWCHAKNISAFEQMLANDIHCFWHQDDDVTLTSKGYIWTHSKTNYLTPNSVACWIDAKGQCPTDVFAVCTDYVHRV